MNDDQLDGLLEPFSRGDLDAAERVFRAYEPYLRMMARRQLGVRLRSKLDSADIVQSAWVDILKGYGKGGWDFADRDRMRAFLLRVVRNRIIDRHRQHRRALERERPLADAASDELTRSGQPRPSEEARGHELWEQMLGRCPPAHRDLLRMRRQGLPIAEIAARSGLHEGSVRRIFYDLARRMAGDAEDARD